MFRKEFVDVITKTGMVPIKDLRPLIIDKDPQLISELGLLQFKFFDDVRFAKQIADNYNLTYIDLSKAKIPDRILKIIKKSDIIKYRVLPIQKNAKAVSVAIYDPSLIKLQAELQTVFQYPIEFILTSLSSWAEIYSRVPDNIEDVLESIREIKSDSLKKEDTINEDDIGDDIIRYVNKILRKLLF